MDKNLIAAFISAATSIVVVVLSHVLIAAGDNKKRRKEEIEQVQKEHLNSLRFFLEENYFRIDEILKAVEQENKNRINDILIIGEPFELLEKDDEWFTGCGCYLMSTCYYAACLFAFLERIRNKMPFLKLENENDTKMAELIGHIVNDFGRNLNIYYPLQMNIGREMYRVNEQNILTYRDFCEMLKKKENLVWYYSLVNFFLRMVKSESENGKRLLKDIQALSDFLDKIVSGGNSIKQKYDW